MPELVVRVTIPDTDAHVTHYGVASWVEGVLEAIAGDGYANVIEAISASDAPAGHACCVCGGAIHTGRDCTPGAPPHGVPYMECCT